MRQLCIVCILLISINVKAQLAVSAGAGYGTFHLKDFHDLQDVIQTNFPVKARSTESYPGYFTYDFSMKYTFEHMSLIGLSYQFGSTGGRVTYSDYSGTVTSDQLLSYNLLQLNVGNGFAFGRGYRLGFDLSPGIAFSKVKFKDASQIGDRKTKSEVPLHSINIMGQPTLDLVKHWNRFGTRIYFGYAFSIFQGKVKTKEGGILTDGGGGKITTDWTGLRAGIGVIYNLNKTKSSKPSKETDK